MRLADLKKVQKNKKKERIVRLFMLITLILAFVYHPIWYGVTVLLSIFGFTGGRKARKLSDIRLGLRGEKYAVDKLKKLPRDFSIYQFVEFKHRGKQIYLDHIVFGPTGLFLIRSTARSGQFFGHENDKEWKLIQDGYHRKITNPIRTVKWQTHQLAEYLKEKGFRHYVRPVVFLSYPGSLYDGLQIETFPVHNNRSGTPNTIVPYIEQYNKGKGLSREEIKTLDKLFSKIGVRN